MNSQTSETPKRSFGDASRRISRLSILTSIAFAWATIRTLNAAGEEDFLLGTAFGTSQSEVRLALRKHSAQLVNSVEYERIVAKPMIAGRDDCSLPSEKGGVYAMYMPSAKMFDATVEGMFQFEAERLRMVALYFKSERNPKDLAAKIERSLSKRYKPTGLATSTDSGVERRFKRAWPNAYGLGFTSESIKAVFFVNIVDIPAEPVLCLRLYPIDGDDSGER